MHKRDAMSEVSRCDQAPYKVQDIQTMDSKVNTSNYGKPNIPSFDGSSFKTWKIEVEWIIKSQIYQSIWSLRPWDVLWKGKQKNLVDDWSDGKFHGSIEEIGRYLWNYTNISIYNAGFFTAKQKKTESTSDWALRLETITQLAVETSEIPASKRNALLKQGLRSEKLRNNARVTYESAEIFELLQKKGSSWGGRSKANCFYQEITKPSSQPNADLDSSKEKTYRQQREDFILTGIMVNQHRDFLTDITMLPKVTGMMDLQRQKNDQRIL